MPWVVQQAGGGWVVGTDDVLGWQSAIERCKSEPGECESRGLAGRSALKRQFSIGACAKGIEVQYQKAVATPQCSGRRGLVIVIPARNEIDTIGSLVASLGEAGWTDVVVVDDQSTDETAAAAQLAGAMVLRPALPMGAWGALQTGIRYAVANDYSGVITMDADGQHEVSQIQALLEMRDRADVVIGAFPERASRARRLAWRWFRRIAGFELRDLTSGFRLYNPSAMLLLSSDEATLLDYQDLGILLIARKAGLDIVEVPVSMSLRTSGKSRVFNSWFSVARYLAVTTLLCLARWEVPRRRRLNEST